MREESKYLLASALASIITATIFSAYVVADTMTDPVQTLGQLLEFASFIFLFSSIVSFLSCISYGALGYFILSKFGRVNYLPLAVIGGVGGYLVLTGLVTIDNPPLEVQAGMVLLGVMASMLVLKFMRAL